MAYPSVVTRERILVTALELVEKGSVVSLNGLARQLGIRAPSLYRYFPSRERLLAAVGLAGFRRLAAFIRASTRHEPSLEAAAWAIRRFAKTHPALYRLMNEGDARHEDQAEARAVTLDVLQASFGVPVGDRELLPLRAALNAFRAFVHGFAMLELTGQSSTRELDQAFAAGLEALLALFGGAAPGRLSSTGRASSPTMASATRKRAGHPSRKSPKPG